VLGSQTISGRVNPGLFIEKAGTGIRRIRDEVREQGCPEPEFEANGFFTAIFRPNPKVRAQVGAHEAHVEGQSESNLDQVAAEVMKMLKAISGEMTRSEIRSALGLKGRANFEKRHLKPALSQGLVEMTIPDKPRSSKQRYRITPQGDEVLKNARR